MQKQSIPEDKTFFRDSTRICVRWGWNPNPGTSTRILSACVRKVVSINRPATMTWNRWMIVMPEGGRERSYVGVSYSRFGMQRQPKGIGDWELTPGSVGWVSIAHGHRRCGPRSARKMGFGITPRKGRLAPCAVLLRCGCGATAHRTAVSFFCLAS